MKNELIRNETQSQFEFKLDGDVAFLEYFTEGDKIYLTHTEVPESLQGHGIGKDLVHQTLQYVKKEQLTVVPQCSFVVGYVNDHPEWRSILSQGYQL